MVGVDSDHLNGLRPYRRGLWTAHRERRWFQPLNGLLAVSATILGIGLHWSLRNARSDQANFIRLHPVARWSLIGAAFAIACYMYLVPQ
jgi:hypothetical protein